MKKLFARTSRAEPDKRESRLMTTSAIWVGGFTAALALSLPQPAAADAQAALAALKRERWVVDAVHEPAAAVDWHIGIRNYGRDRAFGYAESGCIIIRQNGGLAKWVRIVDIAKVNRGENFRSASLGRADCRTWRHKYP